ncbi:hypothetical protein RF11_07264 [Thelohanellus kitauei]|uniref:Uncharacterized protein n=1 Tax=Thelohanellus kitauei TaxID=669202 RepID=A0A0C2N708_THEKT|nr:hypothetical protein RF11_07264 [Thelohanellus kitauei]
MNGLKIKNTCYAGRVHEGKNQEIGKNLFGIRKYKIAVLPLVITLQKIRPVVFACRISSLQIEQCCDTLLPNVQRQKKMFSTLINYTKQKVEQSDKPPPHLISSAIHRLNKNLFCVQNLICCNPAFATKISNAVTSQPLLEIQCDHQTDYSINDHMGNKPQLVY